MPAPNVVLLFGPILIGTFLNMILYGALILQVYHYHLTWQKDARWIKNLVYYLFIMETLNTACDISVVFQPLILQFGEPEATKYFPTMFASEPILIVLISTPIQIFFAWRIRLLAKSNILPLVIVCLAIVSFAGGMSTAGVLLKVKLLAKKPDLRWPALVWFLSACIADIMITISLVLTLSKRKTGFVATDSTIERIIRLTVQTGMLTAFFAVGDVVFFMGLPDTTLNFLWDLALSKLYTNCLLSTLNARQTFESDVFHQSFLKGPSFNSRRNRENTMTDSPEHTLGSPVYELNSHKVLNPSSQTEYGVAITKIVETHQDLAPAESQITVTQ